MIRPDTVDESELHAFVDGELSAARWNEISAWLEDHPREARLVAAWRRDKEAVRDAFSRPDDDVVPARFESRLRAAPGSWRWHAPAAVAAGLAILLTGVLIGWLLGNRSGAEHARALVERALVAHRVYSPEVRHPVEVAASDSGHLVSWLSKRLGKALIIPDLAPQGYSFLGGRLTTAVDRPAALLMFEDAGKNRLTLFLVADGDFDRSEFRIEERGDLIACYWIDDDFGFAVAGAVERDQVMKIAEAIYEQFEKD
jgi:anti-sigma factor RsiW